MLTFKSRTRIYSVSLQPSARTRLLPTRLSSRRAGNGVSSNTHFMAACRIRPYQRSFGSCPPPRREPSRMYCRETSRLGRLRRQAAPSLARLARPCLWATVAAVSVALFVGALRWNNTCIIDENVIDASDTTWLDIPRKGPPRRDFCRERRRVSRGVLRDQLG